MKYLAIDYGKSHIGLAQAEGYVAEPLGELVNNEKILIKLKEIIDKNKTETIVIGISEGKQAEETRKFGEVLRKFANTTVVYYDETLSSEIAKRGMIMTGKPKLRRQKEDHCVAAALILQNYLEQKGGYYA